MWPLTQNWSCKKCAFTDLLVWPSMRIIGGWVSEILKCLFVFCLFVCVFIFIHMYLGLVEGGEITYINGPSKPPLNLLVHLCSIITYMYITLQYKANEMKKSITLKLEMTPEYMHIFKYHYHKVNRMIEQKVAGWW